MPSRSDASSYIYRKKKHKAREILWEEEAGFLRRNTPQKSGLLFFLDVLFVRGHNGVETFPVVQEEGACNLGTVIKG
jgi:hypothetical protein